MRLRLKYPPTPENAAKFAADIVSSAARISRAQLDCSVESLKVVDDIIEGFRRGGCTRPGPTSCVTHWGGPEWGC
jgi:hypothetical protein